MRSDAIPRMVATIVNVLAVGYVTMYLAVLAAEPRQRRMAWNHAQLLLDRVHVTPPRTADAVSAMIAAAERQGASDARRCVDTDTLQRAVSGEFSAEPWRRGYRQFWLQGYGLPWWRALRRDSLPRAVAFEVRALRLDRPLPRRAGTQHVPRGVEKQSRWIRSGDTLVFTLDTTWTGTAESGVRVPTPGRWMFIATAPGNWGCFLYTLK